MAKVRQRTWTFPGQRTKRKAWGFVTVENGKHRRTCAGASCHGCRQVRQFKAEWSKDDAENALAAHLLKIEPPKGQAPGLTLAEAAERYLASKARKRTLGEDRRVLEHLKAAFGGETTLTAITSSRISEYKAGRLNGTSSRTHRPLTAAGVNRPLATLRHLLKIAHEEWEVLPAVPRVRLEREPQGRIRWLEPDEEARLLTACTGSQNRTLAAIVTVALETGLRKSELLGLTWDRVDLSRGVIRLELTKSEKRREVPMRQAVYNVLAALPGPREGRVWPAGNIRTAFENAVAAAKVEGFHFHDTRHHFASWYVMRGGALPALQQILGHATLAMTMRYAHLSPKHLRDEMARTERQAERPAEHAVESAENITQEITHEAVPAEGVSQKSLM